LVRNADDRWRLAGLVSRGHPECGLGGLYTIPASHMCWVEEETGIDLRGDCSTCDCLLLEVEDEEGCACDVERPRGADGGALLGLASVLWLLRRHRSTPSPRRR
jgi:hypothetical protein